MVDNYAFYSESGALKIVDLENKYTHKKSGVSTAPFNLSFRLPGLFKDGIDFNQ